MITSRFPSGGGGGGKVSVTVAAIGMVKVARDNLSISRGGLAAAKDGNGRVLVGGGVDASIYSNVVDCYDTTGTRTTLATLSVGRAYLAAASDGAGNVLFGGGFNSSNVSNVVNCYDTSGTRTTLTALSSARSGLAAATDGVGRVLFVGGDSSAVVDCYDPGVKAPVTIPRHAAYRFAEHTSEQAAANYERNIVVNRPNAGYFKLDSTPITIN